MDGQISLVHALSELRSQLEQATKDGKSSNLRFVPKSVEVELGISFTMEGDAGIGVKILSLVDISGKAKVNNASTHRIKLMLEPVGLDGNPYLIRDCEREEN